MKETWKKNIKEIKKDYSTLQGKTNSLLKKTTEEDTQRTQKRMKDLLKKSFKINQATLEIILRIIEFEESREQVLEYLYCSNAFVSYVLLTHLKDVHREEIPKEKFKKFEGIVKKLIKDPRIRSL